MGRVIVDELMVNRWLMRALMKNYRVFSSNEICITEATSPCLRRPYFERTRKQLPTPAEALKVLGSELHNLLQDVLREEGWETEVRVALDLGGFRLVGRVDAVKDGIVLELKTSNGLHDPYRSHILQLQAYLTILHARVGYLIYIDRASGRPRVHKVVPSKTTLREVIKRAKELHQALEKHEPPPPERGPWCNTCPWKFQCLRGSSHDYGKYRERR